MDDGEEGTSLRHRTKKTSADQVYTPGANQAYNSEGPVWAIDCLKMASVLKIQVETGSWLPILGEGRFRRVPLLGYLEQLLILGQFSGWKEGAQVVILVQMNLDNLANSHVSNSAAGPVDGFHLVYN